MSDSMKSIDDSERVNVSAAVSPAFNEETSDEMAMVGLITSIAETQLPLESSAATKTSADPVLVRVVLPNVAVPLKGPVTMEVPSLR